MATISKAPTGELSSHALLSNAFDEHEIDHSIQIVNYSLISVEGGLFEFICYDSDIFVVYDAETITHYTLPPDGTGFKTWVKDLILLMAKK